jgi:DNA-directed RNA polymerase specialized sigma24 family protein
MESSTSLRLLDQFGSPLPDRIQHVLAELAPRFRRKFSMIRDEVVLFEILEQAGQQILIHEAEHGKLESLHGFAWVTVRNVAISRLRRGPHLLERSVVGSAESAAVLGRLTAAEGSPEEIERSIFLRQILDQVSERDCNIAIWKRAGFSSRWIGNTLQMSVSAVDTAYAQLRKKQQKLMKP